MINSNHGLAVQSIQPNSTTRGESREKTYLHHDLTLVMCSKGRVALRMELLTVIQFGACGSSAIIIIIYNM